MSNTPTPRTDAAIGLLKVGVLELVDADFARQLECELVEANAKLAKLVRLIDISEKANDSMSENEVALSSIFAEALAYQNTELVEQERDSWRKCAEELAERLKIHVRFMPDVDSRIKLTTFNKLKQQEKE